MAVKREAVARMFAALRHNRKVFPMSDDQQMSLLDPAMNPANRETPPMVGWWNVRRIAHQDMPFTMRRWWDGNDWSYPVEIGVTCTDTTIMAMRDTKATFPNEAYEWQGLMVPASSYPYLLHKQSTDEACAGDADLLASQTALLKMAYYSELEPSTALQERGEAIDHAVRGLPGPEIRRSF